MYLKPEINNALNAQDFQKSAKALKLGENRLLVVPI